ncbi:MAG: M23 family metallopeptidase [Patescibacteria group bacterium]
MMRKMWRKSLLILPFITISFSGCGTKLDELYSKKDLAYATCSNAGFTKAGTDDLWQIISEIKTAGVSYAEVMNALIQIVEQVCAGDERCRDQKSLCLGPMAYAVYYPEGGGQGVLPPGGLALKMPLPGGKSWLLTTEAGGTDCASSVPDPYHAGINYYSLDFDDSYYVAGVVEQGFDVPVGAAADGMVLAVPPVVGNGNYIVIDHGDGYTTRYLHLKDGSLTVTPGQYVTTGTQIGVVGNTGESKGTHMHFAVRKNESGAQDTPGMELVTLEGHPFSYFKTQCSDGLRYAYYPSTNKP